MRIASPRAVPISPSIAASDERTGPRSSVGSSSTCTELENDTSPTRKRSGSWSRNDEAADFAASRRVGATSVAVIEAELSIVRTTVASSRGTATTAWGLAIATISAARAASANTAGMWRRRPGEASTMFASRSRFVNRAAYLIQRRCTSQYARSATGISSSPQRTNGLAKLIAPPLPGDERGERPEPVAGGGEHGVAHSEECELARQFRPLGVGSLGEALSQPSPSGIDVKSSSGLRIHEPEVAHVRKGLLPRVANLDRQDGMPGCEPEHRRTPVPRPAEV